MLPPDIRFDAPGYLALLALLPVLWWASVRSLSGLGSFRRWLALGLRSTVLALLVLSLAELQWVRGSDKVTVIYVLDQSASIPEAQRRAMADYVNAEIGKHRRPEREDRAGVIVFGAEAALEHPPFDTDVKINRIPETRIEDAHTNLAGALKLALASFPADSARRVVIVTDGNENLGNALDQARAMAEAGVGIDVVPVRYPARAEVAVERLTIPADVNLGQPFDVRVVVNNTGTADSKNNGRTSGELEITRKLGESEQLLSRESVQLDPGKRVFSLTQQIDAPAFYTYQARFIPADPAQDPVVTNNRATAFTHVRGAGQVLFIEDAQARGQFNHFIDRLRAANLQVTVQPTSELFTSLAELQPFDTVILANVPREDFSGAQIEMLARNTQHLGCGLVMLGGPNSFGAGGWTGTLVEEAMPVDFQIKSSDIQAVGALALVVDRSGSMRGEKLAMAKTAAIAATDILGGSDYVTVISFDAEAQLVVPATQKKDSQTIKARIDQIGSAGGTNLRPGMVMAHEQLRKATDAGLRHMVLLTDGHTEGTNYPELVQKIRADKITVSTIAVGDDADRELLAQLAKAGGGRFYSARSPRALPRIFQREARVVARPLIFERSSGIIPEVVASHEILRGVAGKIPPITGYVLTQRKQNQLVEVPLVASVGPESSPAENRTLLATWTYGLGKAVALTTDAGGRWTGSWSGWPDYDKFVTQMVRWSMRPAGDPGKFSIATDLVNGKVRVTVSALDKDDEFLNFLTMTGSVIGPDMKPIELKIGQTAPGRYVGEFESPASGSYFLMLNPGAGLAPILSGVNVPYSAEYLDRQSNEGLITALAALVPKGGREPGLVIDDPEGRGIDGLLERDTFRQTLPPATTGRDAWHLLMLTAGCLFFADVFVRRVRVDFSRLRGSARKQTSSVRAVRTAAVNRPAANGDPASPAAPPDRGVSPTVEEEPDSYTQRLLRAKEKVWKKQ